MRLTNLKRTISGLILATLAAGIWALPARAEQNSASNIPAGTPKPSLGKKSHAAGTSASAKSTKASGKTSRRKRSKKVKGQAAPTPDRINAIQDALACKGMFTGTPTGKWDESTTEAVKKFQASKGLTPTGKLDALTLQKLGLGSETAGLGAPIPPPNSINRLRNASSSPAEPDPDDSSN
jgi:peptidoglycan hydrolase-like protein with peptidoglycan-binding domain